jgi:hypothetical protein
MDWQQTFNGTTALSERLGTKGTFQKPHYHNLTIILKVRVPSLQYFNHKLLNTRDKEPRPK